MASQFDVVLPGDEEMFANDESNEMLEDEMCDLRKKIDVIKKEYEDKVISDKELDELKSKIINAIETSINGYSISEMGDSIEVERYSAKYSDYLPVATIDIDIDVKDSIYKMEVIGIILHEER